MPGLGTLANILSQVWTAVSGQIESYFKEPGRFSREFIFPSLAFVLGMLIILMGLVGVDAPRVWWNELPADLKLLAAALVLVLLALIIELSRSLTATVRRLYSGEWPRWSWWQQHLRAPYLRQFLVLKNEREIFNRVEIQLTQALNKLERLQFKTSYPVLKTSLGAYQIVTEDNWTWQQSSYRQGVVQSPTKLLGRYTVAPVAANAPVQDDMVKPLPDRKYLASNRMLLAVDVSPDNQILGRGHIISLHLIDPKGKADPATFSDLFVLDQPSSKQVLLSVPAEHLQSILRLLVCRTIKFTRELASTSPALIVVPVVKHRLVPGQLISADDITWQVQDAPLAAEVVTQEKSIIDHVYVPQLIEGSLQNLGPKLPAGSMFDQRHLEQPIKLAYEENMRTKYRQLYGLDLTGKQVRITAPIKRNTFVTITLDHNFIESECLVLQVVNKTYYIAVKDRNTFDTKFQSSRQVTLEPNDLQPVQPNTQQQEDNKISPLDADKLAQLKASVNRLAMSITTAESLDVFNRAISTSDPDESDLNQHAEALLGLAKEVVKVHQELDSVPGHERDVVYTLPRRLQTIIEQWKSAVIRLQDKQDRVARYALPDTIADVRPTRLGNILAAAEDYPLRAYSIDATTILPKLLDVLAGNEPVVQRLINAEATLNMLLLFSFWSAVWTLLGSSTLLFLGGVKSVFVLVTLGGPLLWWLTKEAATAQAFAYSEAIKSLFDLKRHVLFTALGVQIDKEAMTPKEEQVYWRQLYQLFAFGKTEDNFPPLKPADRIQAVTKETGS